MHKARGITPSIAWRRETRKRKCKTIFLERTREGHRESDKTGTVSKAALDRLLRDGVGASEAFPNAYIPS